MASYKVGVDLDMVAAEIDIAKDFSSTPGGRYRTDGPFSGEEFREDILKPALRDSRLVRIILDGARGYPSSFLDEAFGGLVRELKWDENEFFSRIEISASLDYRIYENDIVHYIKKAAARKK